MLFCETARSTPDGFDDLAVLVAQLRALGIEAALGAGSLPEEISRGTLFDIAAFATKDRPRAGDSLLLVRGHEVDDAALARLRRLAFPQGTPARVWGRFPSFQSEIGTRMKLSYVLGDSPEVLDLPGGLGAGHHHIPVFGAPGPRAPRRDARPVVLLVAPPLEGEGQVQALVGLAASPALRPVLLTDGRAKEGWAARIGHAVAAFHHTEALPDALASLADLALLFAPPSSSYRSQALIANLAVRGVPLVDCSPGWAHLSNPAPILQGPTDLSAVPQFLASGLLDTLPHLGREVARSRFAAALDGGEAVAALRPETKPEPALPRPSLVAVPPPAPSGSRSVVFLPTNGVGLGHAQRCSLIAGEMAVQGVQPTFAAFPSCLRMLKSYGFDAMPLVSRSPAHRQEHENDFVNHLRLRRLTEGGGTLVFDGGYVFDSVYRAILDNRLSAVWIRRGLWQEGQSNAVALDREKAFRRVVVPLEAFEELNAAYSRGSHLAEVGPIVQALGLSPEARGELRQGLRDRFGRDFRHLAVTMLGGGVAADRSAQLSAICALMAARPETLHLVVVWPTATVEAGVFAWPNTRVVKTHHASALVAAADLFVSAVGYNSFHEALYNRVPTIFMAQMSAFMDDQRRRAQAAVDRDLADLVEPEEMQSLRRLVAAHLDGGRGEELRARLAEASLPAPGTSEAARLILETAECQRPAGRPSWPASPVTSPSTSTTSSALSIPAPGPSEGATISLLASA